MLVVTRKKKGDQIVFPGLGIKITLLGRNRYGIEAPADVAITREQLPPEVREAEPRDERLTRKGRRKPRL